LKEKIEFIDGRERVPLPQSRFPIFRRATSSFSSSLFAPLFICVCSSNILLADRKSILQQPLSIPHPTAALSSMHAASMPHFLPSPALASPVGSTCSQPGANNGPAQCNNGANGPCSTLFVANLGQFVSEHELKEIFGR
jgi:hypothetical protein